MGRTILGAAARAVAFFALWLLLVDEADEPNLITGAVCAVLAAALATGVHSLRSVHAAPRPNMFRYAYRPLRLLVSDCARVAWALAARALLRRPVTGRWRAVRYRATSDAPEDVARRIVTEWGASAAPNRYAVGIDAEGGLLLVHELVAGGGPLDPMELG
jgi:multisubunit Na+/H+ antiporter MnhE subunit